MTPIIYDEYETLGKKWESGDSFPTEKVLFITCDHMDQFFRTFREELDGLEENITIVSAASDYGVSLQEDYPPDEDLRRWFPMQSLEGLGYRDLYLPARMNQDKCLRADKYALRSYSWMNATFDAVHPKCDWFCTNSEIDANTSIPFGIDRESWALIQKYKDSPKQDRVFCCWGLNTNERAQMKHSLRGAGGFVFFNTLDKEQYIYELSCSKYCLCPEGNGKDSYRVLEALYAESIPLLTPNKWSPYGDLTGIISLNDAKISVHTQTNWDIVDFDYWRTRIEH